jgi:hypothetical protein
MKMQLLRAALCVALPVIVHGQLWTGDWYPEVAVDLVQDDNINRSFKGDGEKSETLLRASVRAEQQQQLDPYTFTHYAVVLSGVVHAEYNGLNMISPGVDAGVRRQVGEGEDALSLRAGLGLAYQSFNQDFRAGAWVAPRLEARMGLMDNVSGGLRYVYDNRFASDKSVYDIDGHTLGLDAEWTVSERVVLVLGYSYRRGSVIVHEPRDDLGAEIRGERLPNSTFKDRYDAVNLDDADTHTLQLEARYDINMYTSLRAGYIYEEIKGDGEKYPSNQFYLGLTHQL